MYNTINLTDKIPKLVERVFDSKDKTKDIDIIRKIIYMGYGLWNSTIYPGRLDPINEEISALKLQ